MNVPKDQTVGWLQSIPPALFNAPACLTKLWKDLSGDAAKVAKMKASPEKVTKAKAIEARYHSLMEALRPYEHS